MLKGIHSHVQQEIRISPTFQWPKTLWLQAAQISWEERPLEEQAWPLCYATITFPQTTESALKKIEDNSTLVFIADVKANKHQIKQAMKKVYDIDAAKVNSLIRPDGEKKAYVWLAADYDALDIVNKIRII